MIPKPKQLVLMGSIALAMTFTQASGQDVSQLTAQEHAHLIRFLPSYMSDSSQPLDRTNRFAARSVKLTNSSRRQVVVYVSGSMICGTGGCPTLILEPVGESFKTIGDLSITRPPIRLLKTSTRGWRDLSVLVAGGGILPGYEALIPFNGHHYADNPSVRPARRLRERVDGKIIIPSDVYLENIDLRPAPASPIKEN
jgi:hypothetical protein